MLKCIFLQGIPCSGKSTYARDNFLYMNSSYIIISRDDIRKQINGKKMFNLKNEKKVSDIFNKMIVNSVQAKLNLVIDNTNLNPKYINNIKKLLTKDYIVEFVRFDIPLWKAYWRNIVRYLETGKWIPFGVIKKFKKQLDEYKYE